MLASVFLVLWGESAAGDPRCGFRFEADNGTDSESCPGRYSLFTHATASEPSQPDRVPEADSAWRRFIGHFQDDYLGTFFYSRTNFTDLKRGRPYDGFDGFGVAKFAVWLDANRALGPFVQGIPVATTEREFFFQRYVQGDFGVQLYPFEVFFQPGGPRPWWHRWLRAIRLFGQVSRRAYYDDRGIDLVDHDTQIGADYYYDNLLEKDERVLYFLFTTASYRETSFSVTGYDAFAWIGNVKVGPRLAFGRSLLVPYAVADWIYVPKYPERWFENRLALGGGVRFYPSASAEYGGLMGDLWRRFHVFAEAVAPVWLARDPPRSVASYDIRIGLSFSTCGFLRETCRPMP